MNCVEQEILMIFLKIIFTLDKKDCLCDKNKEIMRNLFSFNIAEHIFILSQIKIK